VSSLMDVQNAQQFQELVTKFKALYPEFDNHMRSLQIGSLQETFERFVKHRALAKLVFDALL
jgi:hypothetical protein